MTSYQRRTAGAVSQLGQRAVRGRHARTGAGAAAWPTSTGAAASSISTTTATATCSSPTATCRTTSRSIRPRRYVPGPQRAAAEHGQRQVRQRLRAGRRRLAAEHSAAAARPSTTWTTTATSDVVILNAREADRAAQRSRRANHWLQMRLRGVPTNRDGVGARVKVVAGDLRQVDEVHSGRGYQSHWGSRLHFGLGRASAWTGSRSAGSAEASMSCGTWRSTGGW